MDVGVGVGAEVGTGVGVSVGDGVGLHAQTAHLRHGPRRFTHHAGRVKYPRSTIPKQRIGTVPTHSPMHMWSMRRDIGGADDCARVRMHECAWCAASQRIPVVGTPVSAQHEQYECMQHARTWRSEPVWACSSARV